MKVSLTLLYTGGIVPPPLSEISSCASGIAFWGTPIGWQFLFTLIFDSSFCFGAKNNLEKFLEYPFWGKGQNPKIYVSKIKNFTILKSCNIIVVDIFIWNFFEIGLFYTIHGHFKTKIVNISDIKGDQKKIYYSNKS